MSLIPPAPPNGEILATTPTQIARGTAGGELFAGRIRAADTLNPAIPSNSPAPFNWAPAFRGRVRCR